jgi:hypothetical protein
LYTRHKPLVHEQKPAFLTIISEKPNGGDPLYTIVPQFVSKDSTGYESARTFLANGFVFSPHSARHKENLLPKSYYKYKLYLADPSKEESVVDALVKRVVKNQGPFFIYKQKTLRKCHNFFLQSLEEEKISQKLNHLFSMQPNTFNPEASSAIYLSPEILIQDVAKLLSNKPIAEVQEQLLEVLNFFKQIITIKVVEYVLIMNERIIETLLTYLLSAPSTLTVSTNKALVDKELFLCHDRKLVDRTLGRLKDLLPQKDFSSIPSLLIMHSNEHVSSDFDRDKTLLKISVKRAAIYQLKQPVPITLKVSPLMKITFHESPNYKSKENLDNRINRLDQRKMCRQFIRNKEDTIDQEIDSILFVYIEKAGAETKFDPERGEEQFSNKRLFGWLSSDKFLMRPDLSFKKLFGVYMQRMFSPMTSLEQIDLTPISEAGPFPLPGKFIHQIQYPESTIQDLYWTCRTVYRHSLIGICGYLVLLDQFSYLFTQHSTLVKDLFSIEITSDEDAAELEEIVKGEINALLQDQQYITLSLPDEVQAGIFTASLVTFKKNCLAQVKESMKAIRRTAVAELKKYLEILVSAIEEINTTCEGIPDSVEGYIKLKQKLSTPEFANTIVSTRSTSLAFDGLVRALETLKEPFDHAPLAHKLYLNSQLKEALSHHQLFLQRFMASKVNYYNDILQMRSDIKTQFDSLYDLLTQEGFSRPVRVHRSLLQRRRKQLQSSRVSEPD